MTPDWLTEIDHTGDVGIRVTAPDEKTLFERAAWALFSILTDPDSVQPREQWTIDVEAADRDDLLVRWLSDLNFKHVTENVLLSRFHITDITERALTAEIGGEEMDPAKHTVYTEIKAVTYHALEVERDEDGWRAQIVFDV